MLRPPVLMPAQSLSPRVRHKGRWRNAGSLHEHMLLSDGSPMRTVFCSTERGFLVLEKAFFYPKVSGCRHCHLCCSLVCICLMRLYPPFQSLPPRSVRPAWLPLTAWLATAGPGLSFSWIVLFLHTFVRPSFCESLYFIYAMRCGLLLSRILFHDVF